MRKMRARDIEQVPSVSLLLSQLGFEPDFWASDVTLFSYSALLPCISVKHLGIGWNKDEPVEKSWLFFDPGVQYIAQ